MNGAEDTVPLAAAFLVPPALLGRVLTRQLFLELPHQGGRLLLLLGLLQALPGELQVQQEKG